MLFLLIFGGIGGFGSRRNVVFAPEGFQILEKETVVDAVVTVEKPESFFAKAFPSSLWKSSRRSCRRPPNPDFHSCGSFHRASRDRFLERRSPEGITESPKTSHAAHRPGTRSSFIGAFRGQKFGGSPDFQLRQFPPRVPSRRFFVDQVRSLDEFYKLKRKCPRLQPGAWDPCHQLTLLRSKINGNRSEEKLNTSFDLRTCKK